MVNATSNSLAANQFATQSGATTPAASGSNSGAGTPKTSGGSALTTGDSSKVGAATVNQDLFLKLMMAQLKNQNPLSPVDGVNFLTQLSQITGVEQQVSMKQDIAAIRKSLETAAASAAAARPGTSAV